MIDIVRFQPKNTFLRDFSVEPLVMNGTGVLRSGNITMLDGTGYTNKTLASALSKEMPDLLFGCEWTGNKDHMDYPQHALRIQTARAIRSTSTIYVMRPVFDRKTLEVMRFNTNVLRKAKVPVVFASLATRDEELASPKDLNALGAILGFSDQEIAHARKLLEKLQAVRYEHEFSLEAPR